jgi:hypothetical protein
MWRYRKLKSDINPPTTEVLPSSALHTISGVSTECASGFALRTTGNRLAGSPYGKRKSGPRAVPLAIAWTADVRAENRAARRSPRRGVLGRRR